VWPSFILDVKRATRHLQAGGTGYGINPAKVITAGHSAGGYCAAGAMITRDLANNGYGIDLRLGSGADPDYLGSIMLGSPIDFGVSRSWDVSHPYFGVYPNLMGQGLIYSTLAAIKGYAANVAAGSMAVAGMGLNDLIVANASNVKPIRYPQGGSDITIAPGNLTALQTACTTAGVTLTTYVEPGIPHSYLTRENSSSAIAWASTLI
jgi:predicted esterase